MIQKWNVVVSMIIGFGGGILGSYVSGKTVHAQELRQTAKVVTAQKFILLNKQGASAGMFGFDNGGSPEITLFDEQGNIIWSTKLRTQTLSHLDGGATWPISAHSCGPVYQQEDALRFV